MTSVMHHGQFTLERTYPTAAERVYAAWGEVGAKSQWFIGPEGWRETRREIDFRVGGHELLQGRFGEDRVTRYAARFHALTAVAPSRARDENQGVSKSPRLERHCAGGAWCPPRTPDGDFTCNTCCWLMPITTFSRK